MFRRFTLASIAALASVSATAAADGRHGDGHAGHDMHEQAGAAPAASLSSTAGYSAEERERGLRQGLGMGLALPAERSGYPGPRHVLELADRLSLTPAQRQRTQAIFDEMQAGARALGERLLRQEAELEALFAERRATPASLDSSVRAIGETEAALKSIHLRTHLTMMDVLTSDQVSLYAELRRAGGGSGRTRPDAPDDGHSGH